MLMTPPPGYATGAVNRQLPQGLTYPGAQGLASSGYGVRTSGTSPLGNSQLAPGTSEGGGLINSATPAPNPGQFGSAVQPFGQAGFMGPTGAASTFGQQDVQFPPAAPQAMLNAAPQSAVVGGMPDGSMQPSAAAPGMLNTDPPPAVAGGMPFQPPMQPPAAQGMVSPANAAMAQALRQGNRP